MKKIFLALIVLMVNVSFAKNEYFYDMGNTVGYIKDNKGNKYIVIEDNSGAKLVKIKENPESLIKEKLGITREDLKIGGDEQ